MNVIKIRITVVFLFCCTLQSLGQTTISFDFTNEDFIKNTLNISVPQTADQLSFTYQNVTFSFSGVDRAGVRSSNQDYWLSIQRNETTTLSVPANMKMTSIKFYLSSGTKTNILNLLSIKDNQLSYNTDTGIAEWTGESNSLDVISAGYWAVPIGKIEVTCAPSGGTAGITLDGSDENTDNQSVLTNNDGKTIDVTLNRSFNADGGWYTLCLPFSLTPDQLKTAFGSDVDVEMMTGAQKGNDGILSLEFTKLTTATSANTPYLIRPSESAESLNFTGVTLDAKASALTTAGGCQFIGIYDPTIIPADDNHRFLSGTNGNYLSRSNGGKLKATRAYFVLPTANEAKVMTGQDETTGIGTIKSNRENKNVIYNINGQQVSNEQVSGIYIMNHKKVAVRK